VRYAGGGAPGEKWVGGAQRARGGQRERQPGRPGASWLPRSRCCLSCWCNPWHTRGEPRRPPGARDTSLCPQTVQGYKHTA